MKYLIKLEDRDMNREVIIECQEDMTLEELSHEIKMALYLSCFKEIGHSFQANGQFYVPCPDVVKELWRKKREKDKSKGASKQSRINESEEPDKGPGIFSSEEFHLRDVFSVKESAILYQQIHPTYRTRVYCTLKDRVR